MHQYCIKPPGKLTMENKNCFGILDRVFPVTETGLREIVKDCFQCPVRTQCLSDALKTEQGIKLRSDLIDRASSNGMIKKLKRWSQNKELSRLAEQIKNRKKR